jgi:hypothetical protein
MHATYLLAGHNNKHACTEPIFHSIDSCLYVLDIRAGYGTDMLRQETDCYGVSSRTGFVWRPVCPIMLDCPSPYYITRDDLSSSGHDGTLVSLNRKDDVIQRVLH